MGKHCGVTEMVLACASKPMYGVQTQICPDRQETVSGRPKLTWTEVGRGKDLRVDVALNKNKWQKRIPKLEPK